jgi:hypothetical protein
VIKRTCSFIILVLVGITPLAAIDFSGIFQVDYYGLIDPSTFYESERIRATVVPQLDIRNETGSIDFHLSCLFYLQAIKEPMVVDPARIIREAYLGFHFGIFDINLGQKFVSWGKVDFLSPLNVINHSDTSVLSSDNILESSLPDLLAQIQIYPLDNLFFEIVYVPFLQPNIYDLEDFHVVQHRSLSGTDYDVDAWFINREIPMFSEWAHSVHFAANFTSYYLDIIATYSYYVDQNLDFNLSGVIQTYDSVTTTYAIRGTAYPAYNRVHNIGLGLSFYLGDFLISTDSALKITRDWEGSIMEIKNSELFSAFQVERMFLNRIRAHLNLYRRYVFNYYTPNRSPYNILIQSNINAIIDDYLLQTPESQLYLLLHLDTHFFRETLSLAANIVYGLTENGCYIVPRITYKLTDHITLFAGADIWIGGDVEGYLGRNETRDNFYVRIQYGW